MNSSQPESIDKEALYGEHMARNRWQDKLFRTSCHKALDIPEDDMQFNQHQHGITGRHLVAIAAIILTGLLGWRMTSSEAIRPDSPAFPAVQEYEVSFWAEDGTEYQVQPVGGDK